MNKNVSITITPGTIVMVLVIAAAAYALWLLRDIALLVLTAIVIASAIDPGVLFFARYKIHRVVAVTIMYVGVFGSLFALTYFLAPPILSEAQNFLSMAPQYLETLNIPSPLTGTSAGSATGQSLFDTLLTFQSAFAENSGGTVRVISSFFGGVFSLFLVIVLSFYLAVRATGVEDFLRLVTPHKHEEYVVNLWGRAQRKIGLWMQ
ncbi:MAG: AI-2E family transporter, partial [bacterium]|nr:AI-2E family transporter [bacterium]